MMRNHLAREVFSLSIVTGSLILSCGWVTAADEQQGEVEALTKAIIADIGQWRRETFGDPIMDRDRRSASDMLIRLLVDADRLPIAMAAANQLNRTPEYWMAVHPVLLSAGRFDEAIEIGNKLASQNPRLLEYLVVDTFVAIAKQKDLSTGLDYLRGIPGGDESISSSTYSTGLVRLARFYHDHGNQSDAQRAITHIRTESDREIANAILAASHSRYEVVQVQPLFLRLLQSRNTFINANQAKEDWFVNRVRAFDAIAKGDIAQCEKFQHEIENGAPIASLGKQDQAIGLGLDLLTCSMRSDMENQATDWRALTKSLSAFFALDPGATGKQKQNARTWIAYVLSRCGYWTTDDVRSAWQSRSKYENTEWIIGFSAGFTQSGQGKSVQQLVDMTETNNARCYLRLGQLIAHISEQSASSHPKPIIKAMK
jgi:tetratricopeptide (TPR) repeat protein